MEIAGDSGWEGAGDRKDGAQLVDVRWDLGQV